MNTYVDLSPSWQVKFGRTKAMGMKKDMALEKKAWRWKKGMALEGAWHWEKGAWHSPMLKGAGGTLLGHLVDFWMSQGV